MAHPITLPALTPTMTEGTVARWLVAPGDVVAAGTVVAEIETDKTVTEIVSLEAGEIGVLLVEQGATVAVHTALATVRSPDAAPVAAAAPATAPTTAPPAPVPTRNLERRTLFASPAARRLARDRGITLAGRPGSGPGGRIVAQDLKGRGDDRTAPMESPWRRVPLTAMRRSIAERLTRAKQEVPHFYLRTTVSMRALLELRAAMKARSGAAPWTLNDAFIKAAACAIRAVPAANVQFGGDHLRQLERIDVGVAVAVDGGVWTPVITAADGKSLAAIAEESRGLIARARAGRLAPHEYQGGTLTVSNLGMRGIEEFAAIINPPQAMILAIGAITERPAFEAGRWVAVPTVTVTLSVDHRAIDGVTGAAVLADFRVAIETSADLI